MYFEREKTGKRGQHLRSVVLCVLAIAFTMVYVLRLGDLQILNYEIYSTKASASNSQKVKVKAARGEILDRYGRPIAINRDGYDIVLDKSYLPENNDINKTLITLVNLLTEYQLSWRDELPITTAKPYEFDIEEDSEFNESNVNSMRSKLKLNHYATAENCVDAMIEKYELEQYVNTDLFRTLLGIRYTMDAEDFSVSYPYTFAHDISENVRTKL
ncbi:MAG: penicillin-binding protein, partial [Acutalibacteraceae bacterium]|nr:penicillin-binding protein [Acutalibacteraceae bacterium]